jgi:hypothetical protein
MDVTVSSNKISPTPGITGASNQGLFARIPRDLVFDSIQMRYNIDNTANVEEKQW